MSVSFACKLADAIAQMEGGGWSSTFWEPEAAVGLDPREAEAFELPHAPQHLAALQIFQWFFTSSILRTWVHLAAEMQAGKTGVVTALIRLILSNARRLGIKTRNIFILTGMSDNAWRKQTAERLPLALRDNVHHSGGFTKVQIALRSLAASGELKNVLIVLDESHIASTTENRPNQIYQLIAELCPREKWAENNIRFLTISATDPAKVLAMKEDHSIAAQLVRLQVTEDYQSVEKLLAENRLRYSEDFGSISGHKSLGEIRRVLAEFDGPRYHLLRASYGKQGEILRNLGAHFPDCDSIPWDSEKKSNSVTDDSSSVSLQDINDLLETPPEKHTFIVLKNMFYASKTLDDSNVGILFDRVGGKDDTNLQSLLGRACGYGKNQQTIIYTSRQTVQNYLSFWQELCTDPRCPAVLEDIPRETVKKLDKKMANVRVFLRDGKTVFAASNQATPGARAGAGGPAPPAPPAKVRKNEEDYTSEWKEFSTLLEAKAWGKNIRTPSTDDAGFYLSSTTGEAKRVRYDEVVALQSGKKTANMPSPELGKSVHRMYVCYRDLENSEHPSRVFVVRRLTKIK